MNTKQELCDLVWCITEDNIEKFTELLDKLQQEAYNKGVLECCIDKIEQALAQYALERSEQ